MLSKITSEKKNPKQNIFEPGSIHCLPMETKNSVNSGHFSQEIPYFDTKTSHAKERSTHLFSYSCQVYSTKASNHFFPFTCTVSRYYRKF